MLNNQTPRNVLQALAGLRNDPRWIVILDWLQTEVRSSDDKMRQLETIPQLHKQQGCGLTLLALVEKAQKAHTYLNSKE